MFLPITSLISSPDLFLLTLGVKMNVDASICTSRFIYKSSEVSSMHMFALGQGFMKQRSLGKSFHCMSST